MNPAVRFATVEVALGSWTVARTMRGVCFLALDPRGAHAGLERWRSRHEPEARLVPDHAGLAEIAAMLAEYARGDRTDLAHELDLRGSDFQLCVWRELIRIPYGTTRTYAEIARRIGKPGAARAVGMANGRNPVPLFVPCHRVVAATGLGGFSGGLDHKRRLLALEGTGLFA